MSYLWRHDLISCQWGILFPLPATDVNYQSQFLHQLFRKLFTGKIREYPVYLRFFLAFLLVL